ncbi:hypothetical protein [Sporolactobacillus sp. THM19-2]|uniref:hypothetical protein n=1 Tax=Sporolactobacillus sp. THM19-2 TaxID=2511171 RepID=UPI00101EF9B6|nr:hypothetical protein [Sporolactobacillus sp. THM19-2]RYL87303.1 hypothetical protein EWH91_13035 [Sporolactobacillus sp. THM19-2]
MKKWLPVPLITILVLVLAGIKIYSTYPEAVAALIPYNKETSSNVSIEKNAKKGSEAKIYKHRDIAKEKTFPFHTESEKQLAKKYPEQFNIVNKMYYSWDYIHNAQGKYSWGYPKREMSQAEFYVDFDHHKNRVTNKQYENGKVVETTDVLFNRDIAISQRLEQKIYRKDTPKDPNYTNKEQFERDHIGLYNQWVTSSEWFSLLFNNYTNWDYQEGTQLGMPVYKMKGTIPSTISESLQGRFTMVVSKDTGTLIDLKCYGQEDRVIFFVTCEEIQINKGIDPRVFNLDVSGHKQVSGREFGERSVNNTTGTKSGGVDTR